jgi:hypothetical protein
VFSLLVSAVHADSNNGAVAFSTQQQHPFLHDGRVVEIGKNWSPGAEKWNAFYRDALPHYASAMDCVASDSTDVLSALERFDWPRLETKSAVAVCLFRIFATLRNETAITNWLDRQGLAEDARQDMSFMADFYQRHGEQIMAYTFQWDLQENGPLFGKARQENQKAKNRYIAVSFQLDESGAPLGVTLFTQSIYLK